MALITIVFVGATILIVHNKVGGFPILARGWVIVVMMRFSSVILPVVSINAKGFVVLSKVEGAPDSFIVEHIEIIIVVIIMNEINDNVDFRMSERAEWTIFALFEIVRVEGAEFSFIFFRAVQLFDSAVGLHAFVTMWANLISFNILTEVSRVEIAWPLSIFGIVIERALSVAVLGLDGAHLNFELSEIKMLDLWILDKVAERFGCDGWVCNISRIKGGVGLILVLGSVLLDLLVVVAAFWAIRFVDHLDIIAIIVVISILLFVRIWVGTVGCIHEISIEERLIIFVLHVHALLLRSEIVWHFRGEFLCVFVCFLFKGETKD